MRYTIIYKHLGKPAFKNVEAETEEKAKEIVRAGLLDEYKWDCNDNNKQFLISDFNRKYNIQ